MKRTLLALTLVTAFFGSHAAFADTNSTRDPYITEADVKARVPTAVKLGTIMFKQKRIGISAK
ncbi:hypothetical protein CIK04_29580 [Vibrio sp. 03_296]|nr:hypothetical protein CIK04_29580 [Vibrio sp. 03_296]